MRALNKNELIYAIPGGLVVVLIWLLGVGPWLYILTLAAFLGWAWMVWTRK